MSSTFLDVALRTASEGYPVFPLRAGGKEPIHMGGFYTATTDVAQIRQWWASNPSANIGVPTGAVSGISVVDVDGAEGRDSITKTFQDSPLPPTSDV